MLGGLAAALLCLPLLAGLAPQAAAQTLSTASLELVGARSAPEGDSATTDYTFQVNLSEARSQTFGMRLCIDPSSTAEFRPSGEDFSLRLSNGNRLANVVGAATVDGGNTVRGSTSGVTTAGCILIANTRNSRQSTYRIRVKGDTDIEGDETVVLKLHRMTTHPGGTLNTPADVLVSGTRNTITHTIEGDDATTASLELVGARSAPEGDSATTDYTFQVNLSEARSQTFGMRLCIDPSSTAEFRPSGEDFSLRLSNGNRLANVVGAATVDGGNTVRGSTSGVTTAGCILIANTRNSRQSTYRIRVKGDTDIEGDETVVLKLHRMTTHPGGTLNTPADVLVSGTRNTITHTIEGDDATTASLELVGARSAPEGDSATTDYTFQVNLSEARSQTFGMRLCIDPSSTAEFRPSGEDFSLRLSNGNRLANVVGAATVDGGNTVRGSTSGVTTAGCILIANTRNSRQSTYRIRVKGDTDIEGDETVVLKLHRMTTHPGGTLNTPADVLVSGTRNTITHTIENEDPTITITAVNDAVSEDSGYADFFVTANRAPSAALNIDLEVSEETALGQDYVASSASGTQRTTIQKNATRVRYRVPLTSDTRSEPVGEVTVKVVRPSGGRYGVGSPGSASVDVYDDDIRATVSAPAGDLRELGEEEKTVTVALTSPPPPGSGRLLRFAFGGTATKGTDYRVVVPDTDDRPAGVSYQFIANQIEFTNPATRATFKLQAVSDTAFNESNETVTLDNVPPGTDAITYWTDNVADFSIVNNALPHVNLSVSGGGSATEGGSALTITVTRSVANTSGNPLAIPIRVKTADTDAQSGDYTVAASISIPNNAATGTTTFTVTDDNEDEPPETVVVELATLPAGTVAGADSEVGIVITDDDATVVTLTTPDKQATEGDATDKANLTLTLNRGLVDGETLAVPLQLTGGSVGTEFDLALESPAPAGVSFAGTTVTFDGPATGATAAAATVLVTAREDADAVSETVTADIPKVSTGNAPKLTATGLGGGATGRRTGNGEIVLSDDEVSYAVSVSVAADAAEGNSGTTSHAVTFTVTPARPAGNAFHVDICLSGTAGHPGSQPISGRDYEVTTTDGSNTWAVIDSRLTNGGCLVIGNRETLQKFITDGFHIRVNGDRDIEPDETVIVTLKRRTGTHPTPDDVTVSATAGSATYTIENDDTGTPEISIAPGTSPVTEGTAASFTVSASPAPTSNLTVNLQVADAPNADFVAPGAQGSGKTVIINANAASASYSVPTTGGNGETADEPDGPVTVTVASGSGYDVANAPANSAAVTVEDNDATVVTLTVPDARASEEDTDDKARLVLTLNRGLFTGESLAVPLQFTGGEAGTDFDLALETPAPKGVSFAGTTVTFAGPASGATAASAAVLLTARSDSDTTDETVTADIPKVSTGNAPKLTATGLGGGASGRRTGNGRIVLADLPGLTLSSPTLTVSEGTNGSVTVRLAAQPTGAVTVTVASNNGDVTVDTDSTANGNQNSLTFNPTGSNLWSVAQTVTVRAAEDPDGVNDAAVLTFSASGGGYAGRTGTVAVTVTDNDGTLSLAATSGNEGNSGTSTVNVSGTDWDNVAGRFCVYHAGLGANARGATATLGSDFNVLLGTVNRNSFFTANGCTELSNLQAQVNLVRLQITGDTAAEGDETIVVTANQSQGRVAASDITAIYTITDDDDAPQLGNFGFVRNSTETTLPEGASAPYTLTLRDTDGDGTPDRPLEAGETISFPIAVSGTAARGSDYTLRCGSVPRVTCKGLAGPAPSVTLNGSQTGDEYRFSSFLYLDTVSDEIAETRETATLTIGGRSASYDIIDSPATTTLTFTRANYEVREGNGPAQPVYRVDPPVGRDLVIPVTVTGTATPGAMLTTAGADFVTFTSFTIPAGARGRSFSFKEVNDDVTEGDETVIIAIDTANLPAGVAVGAIQGITGSPISTATVTILDNDPGELVLTPSSLEVSEGASGTFKVRLRSEPMADVTVTVSGHSGTDVAVDTDGDTSGDQTTLTFTPATWNVAQAVTVRTSEDDDTTDDAVTLALAAAGGGYDGVSATLAVAVKEYVEPAVPSLSVSDATVSEATANERRVAKMRFRISLSAPLDRTVRVRAVTRESTPVSARMNRDFPQTQFSFTFRPGETERHVYVSIYGAGIYNNERIEGPETFELVLEDVSGAPVADGVGVGTITEGPMEPGVTVSRTRLAMGEGGGTARYTVAMNAPPGPGETVTVTVATADAGAVLVQRGDGVSWWLYRDPPAASAVLRFTRSGQWSIPQMVTLTAQDDDDIDDESVSLTHTVSGPGGWGSVTAPPLLVSVADDDDTAPLLVSIEAGAASVPEGGEAGFTVSVSEAPGAPLKVNLEVADAPGGDFLAAGREGRRTVTIQAGQTSAGFTVRTEDDSAAEADGPVTATLVAGEGYGMGSPVSASVTVNDDDRQDPGVTVSESAIALAEGDAAGTYTVVLNAPPGAGETVTVTATVADPAAAHVSTGTGSLGASVALTFTAGNWNSAQTVTVSPRDDADTGDESTQIDHAVSGPGAWASVTATAVAVTVTDDDLDPGVAVSKSSLALTEGGAAGTYTVALAAPPGAGETVTVTATVADPTTAHVRTGAGSPGPSAALAFTAGNWSSAQTVTVSPREDADTGNESTQIDHAVSGPGAWASVTATAVAVTVTDDDPVVLPVVSIEAEHPGSEGAEGTEAGFVLSADRAPAANLAVQVTVADAPGADYIAQGQEGTRTVTLQAGLTSTTFRIPTLTDNDDEPGGAVTATLAAGSGYVVDDDAATAGSGIYDDDATTVTLAGPSGNIAEADGEKAFTVTLGRGLRDGEALDVALAFGGTATRGTDYTTVCPTPLPTGVACHDLDNVAADANPRVTFTGPASGATAASVTLTLAAVDDAGDEGAGETVTVGLGTLDADSGTGLDGGATGTGALAFSIEDDDVPALSIAAASAEAVTEGTAAGFTVTADVAPAADLAVEVTVTDAPASDFIAGTEEGERTVTILAGATSASFTVATQADTDDEPNGAVTAVLAEGDGFTVVADAGSAAAGIADDDATAVTLAGPAGDIAEADGAKTFTVTLGRGLVEGETLEVPLAFGGAATRGTDYMTACPGTLPTGVTCHDLNAGSNPRATFTGPASGATAASVTLTLASVDDEADEGAGETVTVGLGALDANSGTGLGGGASGTGSLAFSIADDDLPPPVVTIAVSPASMVEGGRVTFTVSADRAPDADLAVPVTVTDAPGADFIAQAHEGRRMVTIAAGATSSAFAFTTDDDAVDEPDGPVTATLAASAGYTLGSPSSASVAVSDDDASTLPTLSIADAEGQEGKQIRFTITLSAPLDRDVHFTVRFGESSPVSARAHYNWDTGNFQRNYDFIVNRFNVTLRRGETVAHRWMTTVDDAHDEGDETFEGRIMHANVPIARQVAVGTIRNDDPLPAAWLARFGRTVASQTVDAIADRMAAPRNAGFEGTLAGQALPAGVAGAEDHGAAADDRKAETALADIAQGFGGGDGRFGNARAGGGFSAEDRSMTGHEALLGSRFALTGAEDASGGTLVLWGRAAQDRFDGVERGDGTDIRLDGEVTTAMLGTDYARDRWLVGLALVQSTAEGAYESEGARDVCPPAQDGGEMPVLCDGAIRAGDGTIEGTLTAAIPYAAVQASERLKLWGAAGYGTGEVTLKTMEESYKADTSWTMAAAGMRGELLAPSSGPSLALTSDALWARTSSEKTRELAASDSDVTRLRLGLEGSWHVAPGGGAGLTPTLETGLRHDGGDAETGFGVELGAGLAWTDPKLGLSLDLSGRTLIAHEDSNLKDRGYAASLAFDPDQSSGRGLSLSLGQEVGGPAEGGLDALFEPEPLADRTGSGAAASRWTAEAAYGLPVLGGRFTGSPHLGLGLATDTRDWTLGWRLTPEAASAPDLSLALKATRRESDNAPPEHAIGVELRAAW